MNRQRLSKHAPAHLDPSRGDLCDNRYYERVGELYISVMRFTKYAFSINILIKYDIHRVFNELIR